MKLPLLQCGILKQRYKRFLADVELENGEQVTIHCPNTGAMTGCATPGDRVWFSSSTNPKRKYAHTWELTETQAGDWICVNTLRANALVAEAFSLGKIQELAGYELCLPEQKYGNENSRIDFLLKSATLADCFVEVKSTTLLMPNGVGMFPDAKTERGQKHLRELINIVAEGKQAVIFFAILHTGITRFEAACHIDPDYAELLVQAQRLGVQVLCYRADIEIIQGRPTAIQLSRPL